MLQSRRDFLGTLFAAGLGGGCRLTGPSCPVPAANPALDGNLVLSRITVEADVAEPFSVLHASDTHLAFMGTTDQGLREAAEHFTRRWVRFPQAFNSLLSTLAYAERKGFPLLHTGDLIDYGSDANYETLRRLVANREDIQCAIGNHEYHYRGPSDPPGDRAAARARLSGVLPNDAAFAARVIGGVDFVAFDDADGNVSEDVARRVLAEFGRGLPVVLMCHVPPFYSAEMVDFKKRVVAACGGLFTPESAVMPDDAPCGPFRPVADADAKLKTSVTTGFIERLRREPALKAVLCGHTHIRYHERFSPTAVMYVGGGNFEGYLREVRFI